MTAIDNAINTEMRRNTLFRYYPDGKAIRLLNGIEIEESAFEKIFPIPMKVSAPIRNFKGSNCDHSREWLND